MKFFSYVPYFLLFTLHIAFAQQKGLTPDALLQLQKEDRATKVIDLRTSEQFQRGHLKFALSIDYEQDNFLENLRLRVPRTVPLVLYCSTGKLSKEAQTYISELGYSRVYYLEGGFDKWVTQAKPYVSDYQTTEPIASITYPQLQRSAQQFPLYFGLFVEPTCEACKRETQLISEVFPEAQVISLSGQRVIGLQEQLNIKQYPTLLVFKNGNQVWRIDGTVSREELQKLRIQLNLSEN
ncbi:MAG: rhodanese-like domain-containing protein [Spirosomataceae bacterium]